jgi:hypothetical protein
MVGELEGKRLFGGNRLHGRIILRLLLKKWSENCKLN